MLLILFTLASLYPLKGQSATAAGNPNANTQSTAILVEPGEFFWRVDKISLEWQVQAIKTEKANWSFENSSTFVDEDQRGGKGGSRIASGGGLKLGLGIFPKANASIYAEAGVWAEGSLAWGLSQQKKARECSDAFKSSSIQRSNQRVSFSIWFYNKSTNDYEILNAPIPICINGNEHVATAKANPADYPSQTINIPAERPDGIPIKFVADLDTTTAESLVDYLQNSSPSVALENSQVTIHKRGQPQGLDIIPVFVRLKKDSVLVSIKTDAIVMSWRVIKNRNTRLDSVLDAINDKMRHANNNGKWITYDHNGVTAIGGVTNSTSQTWKVSSNGQEAAVGNPAAFTIDQPIDFVLFVAPPPPEERVKEPTGNGEGPKPTPPPPPPTPPDRSQLVGTWKWRDTGRTLIGTFYENGEAYLVNKADNPTWEDFANGKGVWSLDGNSLTVEMNRVGCFGVYMKYGPTKWIYGESIINVSENEIKLSGRTLSKQ